MRLSVQQLMDCSSTVQITDSDNNAVQSNHKCLGGSLYTTILYSIFYPLAKENEYPYTGLDGKCELIPDR